MENYESDLLNPNLRAIDNSIYQVLVIDDEERFTEEMVEFLENNNFNAHAANTAQEGLNFLSKHPVDLLILDVRLDSGVNGIDLLKQIKPQHPDMEVIVVSGHGDMDTVIDAMRNGAIDYLRKPFRHIDIRIAIERTGKFIDLNRKVKHLESKQSLISESLEAQINRQIIGVSSQMKSIIDMAMMAAKYSDTNVLITGESGTGKENIARMIHFASTRKNNLFCAVNSSAIPESLVESEFFGHRKGSFTGAINDQKGFFEMSDNGTLFLDEIADMPMILQAKMLRAIEEKEITRIGESTPIKTNFRIISATNHDVEQLVEDRQFRLDLMHRLNTLHIHIPALRERPEDIEPLMNYYVEFFCKQFKKPTMHIDERLLDMMTQYAFPGNIRELRNLIERAVILSKGRKLDVSYFPINSAKTVAFTDATETSTETRSVTTMKLLDHEETLIRAALEKHNFNQSAAARELGIQRMALVRKIQKYGITNPKKNK